MTFTAVLVSQEWKMNSLHNNGNKVKSLTARLVSQERDEVKNNNNKAGFTRKKMKSRH